MKVLLCGHGGHGKDKVALALGLKFNSSSAEALDIFIWNDWGKNLYPNKQACYEDRRNHRQLWYEMICVYNKNNLAALAKEILKDNDLYCGLRCDKEFAECKRQKLFDITVWVDASLRLPEEPSNKITADMCDYYLDNNGTLEMLPVEINKLKIHLNTIRRGQLYAGKSKSSKPIQAQEKTIETLY